MDFNAWLQRGVTAVDATKRAIDAWRAIQRDPTSVQFIRRGVAASAQTVRVEHSSSVLTNAQETRTNIKQRLIVFGVVGHPTQANTNVVVGDRFVLQSREYEVKTVTFVPGEIQASAEVIE